MIKQIVDFHRPEGGAAAIEVFVLAENPQEHIKILKELIDGGAVIKTVDADTIRAVFKNADQQKLLSLLDAGWSFEGQEITAPQCSIPEDEFAPLLEQLSEEEVEKAIEEATDRFFNCRLPGLEGGYAIQNMELVRGQATNEEMQADAVRFGIDPAIYQDHWQQLLMDQLEEIFDEELFDALQRAVARKEAGPCTR